MISVLLADDQEMVRVGLKTIIDAEDDLEVVGVATDGREAIDMARELRPDVCALDIRMPNLSGLDATRELCSETDGPAVVIVTTFDNDDYLYEAIDAGAMGFVLKDAPGPILTEAIRQAADGQSIMSPGPTKRLIASYMSSGSRHVVDHDLSEREIAILGRICNGDSNQEISDDLHLSLSTVKGHITKLLQKTGRTNRVGLVIWASRHTEIEL